MPNLSEYLDNLVDILRKYNSIAKRSNQKTDFILFSSILKDASEDFKKINKQLDKNNLNNLIVKESFLDLFQVSDKKSLSLFLQSIKKLKEFKFGNYYFSKNDIYDYFINLKEILNKKDDFEQIENIFLVFEKLLLI